LITPPTDSSRHQFIASPSIHRATARRQIHQAATQQVVLPTTVIAAWSVTNHSSAGGLSKKCHVQAHIALISDGNMPNESDRQAKFLLTSAYTQISQIAAIHSTTLET
jgi:hypothetical protein